MPYRSLTLAAQKADGGVRRGSGDPPHNSYGVFSKGVPHCAGAPPKLMLQSFSMLLRPSANMA
jgi:hypothetical protein